MRRFKQYTSHIKRQIEALYIAGGDPRTPTAAKYLIIFIVAYALSPIDLIPDFIPILGYLDDLLLLPAGVYLVIKLIPKRLWMEFQLEATNSQSKAPNNKKAAIVICTIWLLCLAALTYALCRRYR